MEEASWVERQDITAAALRYMSKACMWCVTNPKISYH